MYKFPIQSRWAVTSANIYQRKSIFCNLFCMKSKMQELFWCHARGQTTTTKALCLERKHNQSTSRIDIQTTSSHKLGFCIFIDITILFNDQHFFMLLPCITFLDFVWVLSTTFSKWNDEKCVWIWIQFFKKYILLSIKEEVTFVQEGFGGWRRWENGFGDHFFLSLNFFSFSRN